MALSLLVKFIKVALSLLDTSGKIYEGGLITSMYFRLRLIKVALSFIGNSDKVYKGGFVTYRHFR